MNQITWPDFEKVEIQVGTIIEVESFPEAKIPAYKIKVDFGKVTKLRKYYETTKVFYPTNFVIS